MRSALIWANLGDCRGNVEAAQADDPEKAELRDVLDALAGLGMFTAHDAAMKISGGDRRMRDALARFIDRGGPLNKRMFGRYLQALPGNTRWRAVG